MIALKALKQTKEIKKYEKSTKTESCVEQNLFCIFCRFFFLFGAFQFCFDACFVFYSKVSPSSSFYSNLNYIIFRLLLLFYLNSVSIGISCQWFYLTLLRLLIQMENNLSNVLYYRIII